MKKILIGVAATVGVIAVAWTALYGYTVHALNKIVFNNLDKEG